MLNDNQDKLDPSEKEKLEAEIANLKEVMETDDANGIRDAMSILERSSHELASRMYQQSPDQQCGCGKDCAAPQSDWNDKGQFNQAASSESGGMDTGEIYEADYEVVDDNDERKAS